MAGPVDIDPAKPHAFLSYTRFDDNFLNGGISALREALELAVQARTARKFNIFQDVDDIKPGDAWRKKLDRAIEAAQLFIPILTPSFFESEFCRDEAEAFLAYEARAGRDDLVLPIYLIDTPKLDDDDQRAADDLAKRLYERQYDDWRPLLYRLQHEEIRPRIHELAQAIASSIAKNGQAVQPPSEPTLPKDVMDRLAALEAQLEERDQAIADERSRRKRAESALLNEKAKNRQLAEAPAAFEGQVEEAKKTEVTLRSEIEELKAQLDASEQAAAAKENELQEANQAFVAMRNAHQEPKRASVIISSAEETDASDTIYEPLSLFRDGDHFPEMVVIPAGSFFMGSREFEPGCQDNEWPRHRVNIDTFAIGKYPVTFNEWYAFILAGGCDHDPDDAGWGRGKRPVINVSWEDAQQYVAWLTSETGEDYRLPSEAEWEYAARAFPLSEGLKTTAYAFGDMITKELANFGWNVERTTEVGSYPPNAWGLYDMHGNVWEWIEDSWRDSYEAAPVDGSAWVLGSNSTRVLRGGSWDDGPEGLRSAFRSWFNPDVRDLTVGFRVASTLTS
jgi:formylglycine-generating enzyme required for sulfatase activity